MGKRGPQKIPLIKRFWAKVEKTENCWNWTASCATNGYGQLVIRENGKQKRWTAHRLSWFIHFGLIPKGEGFHGTCVLHHCDNRKCVNPDHLFLGTNKDNIRDCVAKGRYTPPCLRGELHPDAKLKEIDVHNIRSSDASISSLARHYNISRYAIYAVKNYFTWKHLPVEHRMHERL